MELDANNSSGAGGGNYAAVFGAGAVPVTDSDAQISHLAETTSRVEIEKLEYAQEEAKEKKAVKSSEGEKYIQTDLR